MQGRILRCRPASEGSNIWICQEKDFCLLAAIGLTLRQFSVASRRGLAAIARGDLAAIRGAISVRDCVRTRVIQTIVKVQLQLGVKRQAGVLIVAMTATTRIVWG
jgi:hypothetical protein